jgi:hypothetical protein
MRWRAVGNSRRNALALPGSSGQWGPTTLSVDRRSAGATRPESIQGSTLGNLRPALELEVVVVDEDLYDQPGQHDDATADDPTSGMWHLPRPAEAVNGEQG